MSSESNDQGQGNEDYGYQAKLEDARVSWNALYIAMAFKPYEVPRRVFEVTGKVTNLVLDASEQQSEYWKKTEEWIWRSNRELTDEVAYFMWNLAGQPREMEKNFWSTAEKYVGSLMTLVTKVYPDPVELVDRKYVNNLMAVFPPAAYYCQVQDLAWAMARRAGQRATMSTLMFWLSAERHILNMIIGATKVVQGLDDAKSFLAKLTQDFSHDKYLNHIQEAAYYTWKREGQPFGKALEHWLESEEKALARIREGISSNLLEEFSASS